MSSAFAVGIDLGTTYSSIAYLNEHGEPVTIPNQEGELTTPSVVFFEGSEIVVGTEALRNSVLFPERVVQHAKRYMGDPLKNWIIDRKVYRPADISALILGKLLSAAREQLGKISHAVVTVPAQFSDAQRNQTLIAARKAGLERVDLLNEPVAAALCYVLGSEGLWFTQLAEPQTVLVCDLGGGTFDLSLVRYSPNEVKVISTGGDLQLGGIDWNKKLENWAAQSFSRETMGDPRNDRQSMQALAIEVEQAKRALSVRPQAVVTVTDSGRRKSYSITREEFERISLDLLDRAATCTLNLLKTSQMGWAKVDVVLTTGGSSRMPMIRDMLKKLSGRTLNMSLSPDLTIAHGATYYAGMLLTDQKFAHSILSERATAKLSKVKQVSVTGRSLGILIKTPEGERVPHFFVPANTPIPCGFRQIFGTVCTNQRRVRVHVIEAGTRLDDPYVEVGECLVTDLPPGLPAGASVEVTIRYDRSGTVQVSAKELSSGRQAKSEISRPEAVRNVQQTSTAGGPSEDVAVPERPGWIPAQKGAGGGGSPHESGSYVFQPHAPGEKAESPKPQKGAIRPKPASSPSVVVEVIDPAGSVSDPEAPVVVKPGQKGSKFSVRPIPVAKLAPPASGEIIELSDSAAIPIEDEVPVVQKKKTTPVTQVNRTPKDMSVPASQQVQKSVPRSRPKSNTGSDPVQRGEQEFWKRTEP